MAFAQFLLLNIHFCLAMFAPLAVLWERPRHPVHKLLSLNGDLEPSPLCLWQTSTVNTNTVIVYKNQNIILKCWKEG